MARFLAAALLSAAAASAAAAGSSMAAEMKTCSEESQSSACLQQEAPRSSSPGVVLIQKQKPRLKRDAAPLVPQGAGETMRQSLAQGASASSLVSSGTVEVVSYNLFWWNVGANNRWDQLFDRIRGEQPFDLIGFQECNDVAHVLKSTGLKDFEYFQGPGSNPCPLAWNADVFERLEEPSSKWVAKDMWGDRHMTWVRLRHKPTGTSIFFANTHGPLANCGDEVGENWLAGVKSNMQEGDVAFMTGDFNCASGTPAVKAVKVLLTEEVDGGIDHIMTNGEVVSGGPKSGQPSDHPLIRGTFNFVPKKKAVVHSATPAPSPSTTPLPSAAEQPSSSSATCGTTEQDFDYSGGNLGGSKVAFVADAAECGLLCRDTEGCRSFTFGRNSKACYLKSASKPGRRQSTCCISGLPACPSESTSATTTVPSSSTTPAAEEDASSTSTATSSTTAAVEATSATTTSASSSTTAPAEEGASSSTTTAASSSTTAAAEEATSTAAPSTTAAANKTSTEQPRNGTGSAFVAHVGVNCWKGNGAEPVGNRDMIGVMTLSECKAECDSEPKCEGVVVFHEKDPGNCWLRAGIELEKCQADTPWDLYLKA